MCLPSSPCAFLTHFLCGRWCFLQSYSTTYWPGMHTTAFSSYYVTCAWGSYWKTFPLLAKLLSFKQDLRIFQPEWAEKIIKLDNTESKAWGQEKLECSYSKLFISRSALMFKSLLKCSYPASITFLCHMYLMTIFSWFDISIIFADVSDIRILLLPNIDTSICPKNPTSVGPYITSALTLQHKHYRIDSE